MSAPNIDTLLDLWASTLLQHDEKPPFTNHTDLYNTIDSTPLGDVQWQNFSLRYNGDEVPEGTVPQWMTSDYEVWYRDPHSIIKNMISNPDYNHHADVAPLRIFNSDGNRVYQNFMSGDWAWEEAVSLKFFFFVFASLMRKNRIKFPKTQRHMVQCLFPSSWEATKPQSPSQPATMSTTHYICQLAPSTTTFAEHIVGPLL
jgi:hypothetical protein